MSEFALNLPAGWAACRISEIAELNPPLDRTLPRDAEVHFVPMQAVEAETGTVDISWTRPHKEVRKGYTAFIAGDVLFAKITPCMENGKMAVVPQLPAGVAFGSTEFHVLRCRAGVAPKYLYYFVSGQAFRHEAEHNMTGAVGQKRVPTTFVRDHAFPLPPYREQHRIIAKIEELFSELDKASESLLLAQAQLKTYRQVLLKAAFEGKLTADWRAANPDKLDHPETLLARIRAEREARHARALDDWQTALAEWRNGGEVGDRPSKPRRHSEPEPPTAHQRERMVPLPDSWQWLQIANVAFVTKLAGFEYTKYVKYDDAGDIPVIKAENASPAGFRETRYSRVNSHDVSMLTRSALEGGELLMVFVGAGTGNVGIVPNDGRFFLGPNIAMIRVEASGMSSRFMELFLQSPLGVELKLSTVKAVAQPSLSMETIRQIPSPIPSPAEQTQIVACLDKQLSEVDRAELEISDAFQRIGALRQSILNKAFTGQLVPQDLADEPATAVLARLHEKAPAPSPRRRKAA